MLPERKTLAVLVLSAFVVSGPAVAQVALTPGTPSILVWSPQQQSEWYRAIERVYKVDTIKRGDRVHPLPMADRQIDVAFEYGARPGPLPTT
jgi:hypothetical protein